ncbi:MAG: metalloregulator ArsR/SmtB family transcription factor [Acidobacteriota bacterium]|jgi:DNA-binding transcriptional ArsR family regulator
MNKLENSSSAPEALPDWVVECLSRLFSSISDHTRIRIVHALTTQDRLRVSEIAEHTGLSVSAVSHQLRLLRDRAMLQATREGRSVYYSLADDHLRTLIKTGVQHAYEDCTNNLRREAEDPTNQGD